MMPKRETLAALKARGLTDAEVADIFGVTSRTIERWRKALHVPATPRPRTHGNPSTYKSGCRCNECTSAATEYHKVLMNRPAPSHGLSGYRNYGCRCATCTAAAQVDNRRFYLKRKAEGKEPRRR